VWRVASVTTPVTRNVPGVAEGLGDEGMGAEVLDGEGPDGESPQAGRKALMPTTITAARVITEKVLFIRSIASRPRQQLQFVRQIVRAPIPSLRRREPFRAAAPAPQ